jgi:hypothetical protein
MPSLLSVTTNCPAAGGGVLTILGENFGTTSVGWDGAGCMRYRDSDNPDPSQCLPGDSHFFGAGWTQGLTAEWTSDTQVTYADVCSTYAVRMLDVC